MADVAAAPGRRTARRSATDPASPRRLSVWPPLAPLHVRRARAAEVPHPLSEDSCRLFSRARHGLHAGLRALGVDAGDTVLVPAYHHGSEVEAIVGTGAAVRFYAVDECLAPVEAHLAGLVDRSVRALHLVHYGGVPQDAARWRRWCDERGLLLIEDAAQAFLARTDDGRPVGAVADLAVFCLYKTFGLPDGAVATGVPSLAAPAGPSAPGGRRLLTLAAARAGQHPGVGRWLLGAERARPYDHARDVALGSPDIRPSRATRALLPWVVDPAAAARRRANHEALRAGLGGAVLPLWPDLPGGASPFAFLFETPAKPVVLAGLRRRGVLGLDLWSRPHPLVPPHEFRREAGWRQRVIGLPVHQELAPDHLELIVDAALAALADADAER